MKIFYWSEVEILRQHLAGEVIVFASNKEEAVSLAIAEYGPDDKDFYNRASYESCATFEEELRSKEPEVFEGSKAFVIDGSA